MRATSWPIYELNKYRSNVSLFFNWTIFIRFIIWIDSKIFYLYKLLRATFISFSIQKLPIWPVATIDTQKKKKEAKFSIRTI